MNPDFTSSLMGPSLAENAMSLSPLTWSCNSHRAPEWERKWVWGIVHDINPPKHYSSRHDSLQTDKHKFNNIFTKGKTKSAILLTFVCSHLTMAFPGCLLPLFSLVILWDPSLPSWIPITVQLYGCPCSTTHAPGTVNRTPASCLQSRAIESPTTKLYSWGKSRQETVVMVEFWGVVLIDDEWEGERDTEEQRDREWHNQTEKVQSKDELSYLSQKKNLYPNLKITQ